MARGVLLEKMRIALRQALRQSSSPAVSPDMNDPLDQALRYAQECLYDEVDWPHLIVRGQLTLQAGQRHYVDPSNGINEEIAPTVTTRWQGANFDMTRGIGPEQMTIYDSDADVRSSPATHYDRVRHGNAYSVEIWPIPDANGQPVYFEGKRTLLPFTADDHPSTLDDIAVVYRAAAEMSSKEADVRKFATLSQGRVLALTRQGGRGPRQIVMGLGGDDGGRQPRVIRPPRYSA